MQDTLWNVNMVAIRSKSIAEVHIGSHASGLIFLYSREMSLHINYTHLYFLLCNTVTVYY